MSKLVANDPTIAKLDDFHEWLSQWIEKECLASHWANDAEKKRCGLERVILLEAIRMRFERTFQDDL